MDLKYELGLDGVREAAHSRGSIWPSRWGEEVEDEDGDSSWCEGGAVEEGADDCHRRLGATGSGVREGRGTKHADGRMM